MLYQFFTSFLGAITNITNIRDDSYKKKNILFCDTTFPFSLYLFLCQITCVSCCYSNIYTQSKYVFHAVVMRSTIRLPNLSHVIIKTFVFEGLSQMLQTRRMLWMVSVCKIYRFNHPKHVYVPMLVIFKIFLCGSSYLGDMTSNMHFTHMMPLN